MAIDTREKRASALREGILPAPDSLPLDAGDRQQVLWAYRGIAAQPPAFPGTGNNGMLVGQPSLVSNGPSIGMGF